MNFRLLTCHRRQKYPKTNVSSRKSVKSCKKKSRKHKKSSSRQKRINKTSYIASNIFSKNFYPANYFFQDADHQQQQARARLYDSRSRVGVNDHYGFLITKNPPQILLKNRQTNKSYRQPTIYNTKVK